MKTFEPEKLIGRKIYFKAEMETIGTEYNILSIKKHHKSFTMHKGRSDLVVYNTNELPLYLNYDMINDLFEKGECFGNFIKYEIKLLHD